MLVIDLIDHHQFTMLQGMYRGLRPTKRILALSFTFTPHAAHTKLHEFRRVVRQCATRFNGHTESTKMQFPDIYRHQAQTMVILLRQLQLAQAAMETGYYRDAVIKASVGTAMAIRLRKDLRENNPRTLLFTASK